MRPETLTATIRSLAPACGFARAAVAPAERIPSADVLLRYLESGFCAGMDYLRRNIEKRLDPSVLVAGARSVICLAAACGPETEYPDSPVSCFYRGRDYHRVLKKRAMLLCDRIRAAAGDFRGRIFVDTAPVAERALAAAAGLGWIGKNGMLIVPGIGNTVVLAEIVTDLPLVAGTPLASRCGECRACIDACPAAAIVEDGLVDARRCISYHTIENRGSIPLELRAQMGVAVFGCDACRNACPYSRAGPAGDEDLAPPGFAAPSLSEILSWTDADWDAATRGSGLRRATLRMFHRNVAVAAGNAGDPSLAPLLAALKRRGGPAAEIDWALGRIDESTGCGKGDGSLF